MQKLAKRNDGQTLILDLTNGTITLPGAGLIQTFGGGEATLAHIRSAGGWVEGEAKPKDWPKGIEGWPEEIVEPKPKDETKAKK